MILEKNINGVCKTIQEYYKNKQLATYAINIDEKCIDLALYDDLRKSREFGRYFGSNSFRNTEVTIPDMSEAQLYRIKKRLENEGIKEMALYETKINEPIYNVGDIILYEKESYGKIVDIDTNGTYPYAIVFPDIYLEERPFWASDDEIDFATNEEKIKEINNWYEKNKSEITKDMSNEEEMESD